MVRQLEDIHQLRKTRIFMATTAATIIATTATIIATTPTILVTTIVATGITTKNFEAASMSGLLFSRHPHWRGPGRREAASHPCAGSAEKEISLGITPRVPIAVVVALPGEHFRFVMFDFDSIRRTGNDRSDILCCRYFLRD